MTIVAIDAGNTRIKWGVRDGGQWLANGALPTADAAALVAVAAGWPRGARIVLCNVAGDAARDAIFGALPAGADLRLFVASAECCGVSNGYARPEQLGADRWAALLGARGRCADACLVVCAGTATTIDVLAADGRFRGGVILPGFDLMRASLARNTAQLPFAEGHFRPAPTNTMDAIVSGCLAAQLGAIERMFAAIAGEPGARCLLTGGAAPRLIHDLNIPAEVAENLVLDGLARYAAAT
ncbi:type III pantothenate kinase [Azospira restricta]|uniref:Type III pantothenate kinase n=1 Tax=Azospira restricta TaxID=404405 RepID=A0A974SPC8_9RHOO|nr:type III pantothenate kinase [Azospira restricta]QRJ63997.1 type III pantothenate kinase [Azospira restricta]